jgi:hypothetical protein
VHAHNRTHAQRHAYTSASAFTCGRAYILIHTRARTSTHTRKQRAHANSHRYAQTQKQAHAYLSTHTNSGNTHTHTVTRARGRTHHVHIWFGVCPVSPHRAVRWPGEGCGHAHGVDRFAPDASQTSSRKCMTSNTGALARQNTITHKNVQHHAQTGATSIRAHIFR